MLAGGGQSGRLSHGGGRERAGKGEGVVVGRFPHLIWAEVARGGATMVAGSSRLWCSRWRHCGARQRPGLGGGARGSLGKLIPPLTLGDGGL